METTDLDENDKDFSKCQCESAGFCKLFQKEMTFQPPNWQWCQNATEEERKRHFKAYYKGKKPRSRNSKGFSCLANLNKPACKKHDMDRMCVDRSIALVEKKPTMGLEDGDVEVLLLTHSKQQFDSEDVDIPGLKICNLNDLDIDPKYSDNKWAESRVYLADIDKLFKKESKVIGTLTGSWNTKCHKHYNINDFINWDVLPHVLAQENNAILCACSVCSCYWAGFENQGVKTVFDFIFSDFDHDLAFEFLDLIGIELDLGMAAIWQQIVSKRNLYESLHGFFNEKDIIPKVDFFCKKNENRIKPRSEYYSKRVPAYWCEFASIMWQMSQEDLVFLPCGHLDAKWYQESQMQKRAEEWV